MSGPPESETTDPDAWDQDRLADEVAFAVSPIGRLRREDREVAFALEILRLRRVETGLLMTLQAPAASDTKVRRLVLAAQQVMNCDPGGEDWGELKEATLAIADPDSAPLGLE